MKVHSLRKSLVLVIAASALAMGCELIVDFDRTKIPVEGTDGAVGTTDGSVDSSVPDTSTADAADAAVKDSASADAPDGD